jgi:hypothetical protein
MGRTRHKSLAATLAEMRASRGDAAAIAAHGFPPPHP